MSELNYHESTFEEYGSQYFESTKLSKICRNAYQNGNNYLINGIWFIHAHNMNFTILAIVAAFWLLFVLFGMLNFINIKNSKLYLFGDKLSLVLAAATFIALLASLSKDKFVKNNFCLMNKNDPFCVDQQNDCFDQIDSNDFISGFNFGFIKHIKIHGTKVMD